MYPITKGEGKSPNKCKKNKEQAVACGLRSSLTELIIDTLIGVGDLHRTYMNRKKNPIAKNTI